MSVADADALGRLGWTDFGAIDDRAKLLERADRENNPRLAWNALGVSFAWMRAALEPSLFAELMSALLERYRETKSIVPESYFDLLDAAADDHALTREGAAGRKRGTGPCRLSKRRPSQS